jgi:hypothetical protein
MSGLYDTALIINVTSLKKLFQKFGIPMFMIFLVLVLQPLVLLRYQLIGLAIHLCEKIRQKIPPWRKTQETESAGEIRKGQRVQKISSIDTSNRL